MNDPVSITKLGIAVITASAAVPAAVEAIERTERLVLGVPESVLLVAIVGTLIGVLLLPEKDTDRITPDTNLVGRFARARQMTIRVVALGGVLLAYAFVAAWLITLAPLWFESMAGAPQLPLAGISGVLVRKLLPNYVRLVERVTGAIGGKAQ
jgi:hypothetical protein